MRKAFRNNYIAVTLSVLVILIIPIPSFACLKFLSIDGSVRLLSQGLIICLIVYSTYCMCRYYDSKIIIDHEGVIQKKYSKEIKIKWDEIVLLEYQKPIPLFIDARIVVNSTSTKKIYIDYYLKNYKYVWKYFIREVNKHCKPTVVDFYCLERMSKTDIEQLELDEKG